MDSCGLLKRSIADSVPLPAQGHRDEDVVQRLHGAHVGDRAVSERSTVLLEHHLKELKLPTFLREYGKVAGQCAAEASTIRATC